MRTPDSVRGQVGLLLLSMVLLVAVVAGAGAVGVASLSTDVTVVVGDLRPASSANVALRQDMDRAQAEARGWRLSGRPSLRGEYEAALVGAHASLQRLEALTSGDEQLSRAAGRQAAAVRTWTAFADAWLVRRRHRVPGSYRPRGDVLFDRFRTLNESLAADINARVDARGDQAGERGRDLVWFVIVVSALGLALSVLIGRGIVRRVSGPLRAMEGGVERLASGDLAARVPTDGPREIRGVALALNALAEENQRAREVEEQAVTRLRRLDRAKDEFVSTVSHELRTPLTSIAGYIELFEDGFLDELSPQQRGMLSVVRRNVGRLRTLIEDLLTLSRVEADAFRTSFELVDLGRLTSEAARDMRQPAARAEVVVHESTPAEPVLVRGDAGQLSRAMLNLLSNAVKFSRRGGEVLIEVGRSDGRAVLSVVDHGIGIPADELPTLGTRFFRASNAVESEITGTGLGLRIVTTIADNHGGHLELESQEGRGTTARLVVPLAEEEAGSTRGLEEVRLEEVAEG